MSPQTNKSKMLFIEGLHISCSVEGLKQLFAPFGTVLWSRLIVDTNGHSFCFGYAQMSTHAESLAAIAGLNGTTVLEKILRVISSTYSLEELRDNP
ncbi:MAG: RNA-binding protein [Nitrospira sp.]